MQKSIKKVIAGAIAALMITSSMPFTALAAPGDYEPDVQLQFSSFFDADNETDPTLKTATDNACYESSALKAFPVQYDAKTGTLKATKEDINTYNEYWESDTVDEDWNLAKGDIFAVTVRFDNVDIAASGNVNIRFSDNLTPAGLCSYKSGKQTKYKFASENDDYADEIIGFRKPVAKFSASKLYEGMNDTVLGDLSTIQEDPAAVEGDGWSDLMMTATLVCSGDYVDVSSVDSSNGFFDFTTGTYDDEDGYTYPNQFIVATFVFQITGDGPIQFALQDPDGSIDDELNGAVYFAKKSEGLAKEKGTTYAPNGENPGSMKMTFMGANSNKGEAPHEHSYTPVVTDPTCTEQGYTTYTCECGDSYVDDYTNPTGHSFTNYVSNNDATCTEDGTKTATCDNGCGTTDTVTDVDSKLGHSYTNYVSNNDATCTEDGTKTATCDNGCGTTDTVTDVDSKLGHSFTNYVSNNDATCTEDGTKTAVCDNCDETDTIADEGSAKGHTPATAVRENEVAPTKETKGSYDSVVYCSVCNAELSRDTIEIDALGVTITLGKSDIGTVDGLEIGANKLAYGATYTVTANPVEGASFVGWEIGGNIVSKDATYTGTAASDITITPVFEDAASDNITVTFYDKYGNTVKQYKDMTAADYQAAIAADYDTLVGPSYPSYVFKGWDKTKDEILAIAESTTVWAQYEQALTTAYTVTSDAEIELPAGVVNGEIPYDTKVTVKDDNAKAWIVGNAIVAYGTEYTFYVGSDVTVQPVHDTVEEKATTTVVGANLVADSDYKFNIVATRNIPDGYELVDYGFVYGKNLTDADLDLDKVGQKGSNDDSGDVKAVHAGTRNLESNEFAMNYGIKNKNAPVTAKSFVTVVKGDKTEIIYSDMFVQNY